MKTVAKEDCYRNWCPDPDLNRDAVSSEGF